MISLRRYHCCTPSRMVRITGFVFIRLLITAIVLNVYMIMILCGGCYDVNVNYVRMADCEGKTGVDFIVSTLDNVNPAECAVTCDEMYQCLLFFYNSNTRSCNVHNRTLTDIAMTLDISSSCFMADGTVESWIVEVLNVSTSHPNHPATHLIGPPGSTPWAPPDPTKDDFIEVRFSPEMYIEQIHIYEMWTAGGVREISLLTPEGTWYPVWSTDQLESVQVGDAGRIMTPELEPSSFKTSTVRIDTGGRTAHQHIKAVKIFGKS